MKTAMQEMLEWVRATLPMDLETPMLIEEKIESLLQKEKEQMLNAFEESRLTHPMIGFKHETFKEYYNENFNANKK